MENIQKTIQTFFRSWNQSWCESVKGVWQQGSQHPVLKGLRPMIGNENIAVVISFFILV